MFATQTYIRRRKALLEKMSMEQGVLLFIGNVESPAQYRDNCYKWRQDSTWLYLFGIDQPGLAATIDLADGTTTLYGDDPDIDDIIWNGPTPSVRDYADRAGIEKTAPSAALAGAVKGKKLHFVPASRYYNALKLSELTGLKPEQHFSEGKKGCPAASLPLVRALVSLRLVKESEEIVLLDHAANLGVEMHTAARRGVKLGTVEQTIVGSMESVALAKGWGVSFPTILTQHGEVFHCHSHELPLESGKLLVVDAGVESNEHYASDFTRTYPTGGRYTTRQREIYQIVHECNELAFSLTKPGVSYRSVHIATMEHMLARLGELGLVKGDAAELAAKGYGGLFMPHGLGHNMGLDVHDMEDYGENLVGYDDDQQRSPQLGLGSLRMARRLTPGNVVTDEPGIYFIPALIEQWKKKGTGLGEINYEALKDYYDFGGIRLEDDVLVTADGARRLGSSRLPIAADDVEKAMAEE